MAEDKKNKASKSKASAEKKPAAKSGAAVKKNSAAKKETAAKKTVMSKKEATAKEAVTEKKGAAAKKTTAAKKETVAKKATTAKRTNEAVEKVIVDKNPKEKVVAKKETKEKSKVKKENEKINLNRTTFVKAGKVSKRWIILDAAGKPLGRVAALAASMLRGKHKVDFTPNVDCGDNIIIINCKDVVLTGKKVEQKVRYHHSGWIGGIKETKYSELMKKEPQKAMTMAVEGMLPRNSLGARMARHLRTYKDDSHGHEAQKPEVFEFKV